MFEYILESLLCVAIVSITMRNFKTTVCNVAINLINSFANKKAYIFGTLSTIYDFVKFKCYTTLISLYESQFVKEYPSHFELTYYLAGSQYKIMIHKKKGSMGRISKIIDLTTNENITIRTFKELGPYRDFHNVNVTPKLLGYPDGLSITYRNKENVIYKGGDKIN